MTAEPTCVLALDVSFTGAGVCGLVAQPDGTVEVQTRTVASKPLGGTLAARRQRITTHAANVTGGVLAEWVDDADLVLIEGPSYGSKGSAVFDLAGLWWEVVRIVRAMDRPLVEISPSAVKKFATGKGTADKVAVAVAVSKLWPDVDAKNDNEWDALALAHIGAAHLGLAVPSRAHHASVLDRIAWPDNLPVIGGTQ